MQSSDTIHLLRECDAGVKMGTASIGEVLPYVKSPGLRGALENCRCGHETLKDDIQALLCRFNDDGKAPNLVAKGMSWVKTNAKLAVDESDETIAELMTDGCNMGVKSLNRYLNQYAAAEEQAKALAQRLIGLEEQLVAEIRGFL